MSRLGKAIASFLQDEDAPTFLEYGLLVVLIAIVAAAAVSVFGIGTSLLFSNVASQF